MAFPTQCCLYTSTSTEITFCQGKNKCLKLSAFGFWWSVPAVMALCSAGTRREPPCPHQHHSATACRLRTWLCTNSIKLVQTGAFNSLILEMSLIKKSFLQDTRHRHSTSGNCLAARRGKKPQQLATSINQPSAECKLVQRGSISTYSSECFAEVYTTWAIPSLLKEISCYKLPNSPGNTTKTHPSVLTSGTQL